MLGHQAFLHKFREAEEISGYQLFDWGTVEFKICDKIMYLLNNEDLCPDEVFRDFWQQKKKKRTEVKKKTFLINIKNWSAFEKKDVRSKTNSDLRHFVSFYENIDKDLKLRLRESNSWSPLFKSTDYFFDKIRLTCCPLYIRHQVFEGLSSKILIQRLPGSNRSSE